MASSTDSSKRVIAANRRAHHDYEVLERIEAGLALQGTEVKSIRAGHASLVGSFAKVDGPDVTLYGVNIPAYEHGNRFNHEPERPRRLLLHRREIDKLRAQTEQKGCSLIPLSVYLRRGRVKVELGLCRGKRVSDKRETLKRRTADREAARAIADGTRR